METKAPGQAIFFNLCQDKLSAEHLAAVQKICKDPKMDKDAFAYHVESGTCTSFNSSIKATEIPKKTDGSTGASSNGGLTLTYAVAGSTCIPNGAEKMMNITLFCDPAQTDLKYMSQKFDKPTCTMELQYASASGCVKVDGSAVAQFIETYKIPIGVAMIIAGLALAFFGQFAISAVIFLVGGATVAFSLAYGSLAVIYHNVDDDPKDWVLYTALGGSLLVGLCMGWCLVKWKNVGIAVIAGSAGASLGVLITQAAFIQNKYAHWGIVGACSAAAIILACWLAEVIEIIVTAFIGSYAIVRGISMFAGHYPNEFQFARDIKAGIITWKNFDKIFFAYIGGIFVLTLIAGWFQSRHKVNKSRNESGH